MAITQNQTSSGEFDQVLGFSLPEREARGRVVRLGPMLDQILRAHSYPPGIKHLLAEALVLTALMGALLKEEDAQLTLQVQATNSIVELLVCDYHDGQLRGYVKHDTDRYQQLGANPALSNLFGDGSLAITFDIGGSQSRYQGVVPLEGATLTEAVEAYFAQSEQIPTLIRTAVSGRASGWVSGGMLVQHLAGTEEGGTRLHTRDEHAEWEHVSIMAGSVHHDELIDPELRLEDIAWRLFHAEEELRVQDLLTLAKGCRCSTEYFESVLARFSKEDRRDMRNDDGVIVVDCAFCSREFPIQD